MNSLKRKINKLFFPCQEKIDKMWDDLHSACEELGGEISKMKFEALEPHKIKKYKIH